MTSENLTTPETGTQRGFLFVLLAIGACAVLLAVWIKHAVRHPHGGLAAGVSAPTIRAAGWVNGEAPAKRRSRARFG